MFIMLYITSLVLICLITGSLYLLSAFIHSPLFPPPTSGNHKSDFFFICFWSIIDLWRYVSSCHVTVIWYGSDGEVPTCNAGDASLSPGSGRSPGEENGNLLQYSCLENSMDRGALQAIVPGVNELDTLQLTHTRTFQNDHHNESSYDMSSYKDTM